MAVKWLREKCLFLPDYCPWRAPRRRLTLVLWVRVRASFYVRQHICYSAYMPWQFRLSVCLSLCPSVCLSVSDCLSHGWISQKRLKLGSGNFHHTVASSL